MSTQKRKPVAVTKAPKIRGAKWRVLRRFDTIKEAEDWIASLRSKRAMRDVEAGEYSIDAPEEMHR
jgi:hypothetical protein